MTNLTDGELDLMVEWFGSFHRADSHILRALAELRELRSRDAYGVAEAEAAAKDGEACKCGITQLEPNELCSQHGGAKG